MLEGGGMRIHVGKIYSTDMPGFLVVPYDFEANGLFSFFKENKNELFRIRQKVIKCNLVY
jgi:hypothetical protein